MADDSLTETNLISQDMRAIEGKVLRRRVSYPIAASDIRKWVIVAYYPEPPLRQYLDVDAAAGMPGLVAPDEFNPFAWTMAVSEPAENISGRNFLELLAGIAPPNLNVMVNGGTSCEYGVPMMEGDVIEAKLGVKSYAVKQGKRGPLLITETQDRWTNQRGELVRNTVMTLIRY